MVLPERPGELKLDGHHRPLGAYRHPRHPGRIGCCEFGIATIPHGPGQLGGQRQLPHAHPRRQHRQAVCGQQCVPQCGQQLSDSLPANTVGRSGSTLAHRRAGGADGDSLHRRGRLDDQRPQQARAVRGWQSLGPGSGPGQ